VMAGSYNGVPVPANGAKIQYAGGEYQVPDNPIIPFIEGDGTGRDIWKASARVFDAAIEKAYSGKRRVAWYEVFAGEKAKTKFDNWLPDDTIAAVREFRAKAGFSIIEIRIRIFPLRKMQHRSSRGWSSRQRIFAKLFITK
jgi:hypothetical protein